MKRFTLGLLLALALTACTQQPEKSLVLNEICGKDFPDNEWIEIYNNSDATVSLKGVYLLKIDEDGIDHVVHRFKNETIPAHQVLVVQSTMNELRSRLSRKKELGVELVGPDDKTIDAFYRDDEVGERPHPVGGSYARIPNGTGAWTIVKKASRGDLNPAETDTDDEELEYIEEE